MKAASNVDRRWSEKKVEDENGLRTVESLRGRLLAERGSSRVAREDAEQMGNKLVLAEAQLRTEIKSRNKAEKKLKFLMKKLESLNISYISDESEHSSLLEGSEISSVSSTASSGANRPEDKQITTQFSNSTKCDIDEPMKKTMPPTVSENLNHNVSHTTKSGRSHKSPSNQEKLVSEGEIYSEESGKLGQNSNDSSTDNQSLKSSFEDKEIKEGSDQGQSYHVDNSLALVPIDLPMATKAIDPAILNERVKAVLDALRQAKEQIQSSMERSYVIKVGSR